MRLTAGIHYFLPTLPVFVFDADEGGPTAIIQGGIHGDEVAGVHAIEELLEEGLRPTRGRLILIPRMNPAACRNRTRAAPEGLDLNRSFPGNADAPALESRIAAQFMALMHGERPALVATLHESWKRFHPDAPVSFGQTLVYGVDPCPELFTLVVAQMNDSVETAYEQWATHYYPVATSSTEVIVEAVGCQGVCVETWMGFEERRRIDMQKAVVLHLLTGIGSMT